MPNSQAINPLLTVVLSQGQSRNPEKRAIEEGVCDAVRRLPGSKLVIVPHLYDCPPKGETFQTLQKIEGPIIALSWLYDRATMWILDRNGVRGNTGAIELTYGKDEDEEDDEEVEADSEERVIDLYPRPNRPIYCLDLRASETVDAFENELKRIHAVLLSETLCSETFRSETTQVAPKQNVSDESMKRFQSPTNTTALTMDADGKLSLANAWNDAAVGMEPVIVQEHPGRRWYPVIDFSRCTNCMECIDFCLFGVYGVDGAQTILVEQPDNCRKGCPACSRVCPANAIIFPQHKTPAIAGAEVDAGSMKIDLSKLFGAPERDEDPIAAAARERDEQLILAGRNAVGMTLGIKEPSSESKPKDDFDQLIDQLDSLDL